ncbi:MAG: signal peptide peptidase SppA [Planctomycetota bacterium]|jgi:protease-4
MDFEQNNNLSGPTEPQPSEPIPSGVQSGPPVTTTKKGAGWKIFWGIILTLSVMANIALFTILMGVIAVFTTGPRGIFNEEVIRKGPRRNKIVVIRLEGIIYGQQAKDVYRQLKAARQDKRVKGLIVRVNSPGGTISGSDQIYREILKYRQEEGKPVIAFMQGVAASGGYYTSVACEKIMAEPTTITGSIGVISWYFVVQELLESKLGILPVVVKSGQKKDWPSSFRKPDSEELLYIENKVIKPAFERFVEIVTEGRKDLLTETEVRRLADGGIFGAKEAKKEKLIDETGYLDDAIELVKEMAKIEKAQVVEYRKPFSLTSFLSYRKPNFLKIDRTTLYELSTPQVLYLWSAY